jgi:hypothetical protein
MYPGQCWTPVDGQPWKPVDICGWREHSAALDRIDGGALLGSSNLTDGDFLVNREGVISLDRPEDLGAVEEVRSLFLELWESARVLTDDSLRRFRTIWNSLRPKGADPDAQIADAVGPAEPVSADVTTWTKTKERLFRDGLERQIQAYRPAFQEVMQLLEENHIHRPELNRIWAANEANRFLNWVRLLHAPGDDVWQSAPLRSPDERKALIVQLAREWQTVQNPLYPPTYIEWLQTVQQVFGSKESASSATKEQLTAGLLSLHAFAEQLRFVKGGLPKLPEYFWNANKGDGMKVRSTLSYLLFGKEPFVERLHDVLYDPNQKLASFGRFCALELYGTIRPEEFPPINGRMAKALRFLGFNVQGT